MLKTQKFPKLDKKKNANGVPTKPTSGKPQGEGGGINGNGISRILTVQTQKHDHQIKDTNLGPLVPWQI